jgi:hypothetical protein
LPNRTENLVKIVLEKQIFPKFSEEKIHQNFVPKKSSHTHVHVYAETDVNGLCQKIGKLVNIVFASLEFESMES